MTVEKSYQQSLAAAYGEQQALQACLPTCFYMLARAHGYLKDYSLIEFMDKLGWDDCRSADGGWNRGPLSRAMRVKFGFPVVSWMINQPDNPNFDKMIAAGYVTGEREIEWFEKSGIGWPIEVIVATGTPIIISMKPGFGANKGAHGIILADLKDGMYEIIDPDERNPKRFYTVAEVHAGISPLGAVSVVLPPAPTWRPKRRLWRWRGSNWLKRKRG